MKIGFLFPGQGSQTVGMGKDIYEKYEEARKVYDEVEKITEIDVADITFNQSTDVLNQTKYTQICILTMSLAILNVLKGKNIKADASAGLSLGEYVSLIYSGALSFEDGISIVKKRGEYMQNLLPEGDWKMAAVLGLDEQSVISACKNVKNGFVVPVNFNTIGQIVASGDAEGVSELQRIVTEYGAKKVRVLNTTGPFHTEKLIDAANALRKDLKKIKFHEFNSKVFKNLDGSEYKNNDNMADILARHIVNPVRFSDVLKNMYADGVDTFVEIGPGKTLSGFVKRMNFERPVYIFNINNVDSLEFTIDSLKKNMEVF